MKTKILFKATAFFAAVFLMTGCIFDSLNPEQTSQTATFGASFVNASEDGPQTKVALTQDGKNIDLAWEEGDQIDLLIDYSGVKTKQTVKVDVAPGTDNKQATFTFTLPTAVSGVTHFNLYGVYGGTVDETTGIVTLPNPENATSSSLKEVQAVLVFELMNIELANPSGNAVFDHIGSLFNIKLKNTSTTTASWLITEANLKATTAIPAYNADDFQYDIIGKTFGGTQTQTLTFKLAVPCTYIDPEGILEFWAWVPMENGENWPALDFSVDISGTTDISYSDAKTGVASGQAYYLYATVDGTTLAKVGESAITNPSSVTIDEKVFERIADTRDGSVYRIVTIDTQTWLAENLKYLPSVVGPGTGNMSDPYCYVYNYNGTDVAEAKATDNFKTYGVLYNWRAARTACPDGWHLPSDTEWTQLENYLANNGHNYDGTTGGGRLKIAKSLASASGWDSSSETGAVGNTDYPTYRNKSGFTALPGGYLDTSYGFSYIDIHSYWWSATTYVSFADLAHRRLLSYNWSYVNGQSSNKKYGISVRCVRD